MPATETEKPIMETEKPVMETETPVTELKSGKEEIPDTVDYPMLLYTLCVRDAEAALKYYEKALGGTTKALYRDESGNIMHSVIVTDYGMCLALHDPCPSETIVTPAEVGGKSDEGSSYNYVTIPKGKGSADQAVERMREAGAVVVGEAEDAFYGHRVGKVVDRYGVVWMFAHGIEMKKEGEKEKEKVEN